MYTQACVLTPHAGTETICMCMYLHLCVYVTDRNVYMYIIHAIHGYVHI